MKHPHSASLSPISGLGGATELAADVAKQNQSFGSLGAFVRRAADCLVAGVISKLHEYEMLIQEHHLDTFGHVNNATYLELLEEARWDYITANGYGLETVQRLRLGPVILEITIKFKREFGNRQRIRIRTGIESYEGKIGTMMQTVVDQEGNVCCEARFVFGLFHLDARKLVAPTPEWLKAIGLARTESDAPQ